MNKAGWSFTPILISRPGLGQHLDGHGQPISELQLPHLGNKNPQSPFLGYQGRRINKTLVQGLTGRVLFVTVSAGVKEPASHLKTLYTVTGQDRW